MADPEGGILAKYGINTNSTMSTPYGPSSGFGDQSWVWLPATGGGPPLPYGNNRKMTALQARMVPLEWYRSDPKRLSQFVSTGILRKVPGFDGNMGLPDIMNAWENLLEQSWKMSSATGDPWTPFDVVNTYSNEGMNYGTIRSGDWEVDARTGERLKYVGPKTKTTKQSKIDLSSPEDARVITTSMLTELLGRAPTAEEVTQYKNSINALERKNPLTAETTVTLGDMGEEVSSNTVTSGGLSAEAKAAGISEQVRKSKEYAEYQGSTTYANALMQLLGMG